MRQWASELLVSLVRAAVGSAVAAIGERIDARNRKHREAQREKARIDAAHVERRKL